MLYMYDHGRINWRGNEFIESGRRAVPSNIYVSLKSRVLTRIVMRES